MFEYNVREISRVVDGDTLDVLIDLGFSIVIKQRIRLAGIDAPETIGVDEATRQLALDAKLFLVDWIEKNPKMTIKTTKDDKYGRILGEIYSEGNPESLNKELVRRGYAWEYDGQKRSENITLLLEKRKMYF